MKSLSHNKNHFCYYSGWTCQENENGDLFIDVNWEYTQRINFCPFCGYKAKNQVEYKNHE